MKADARNEIEASRARTAELEADLARIDQAITEKAGSRRSPTTVSVVLGAAATATAEVTGRPSTREAILAVMATEPAGLWTTQRVYDELLKQGLAPGGTKPLNTVGSRMLELADKKAIFRTGRGVYSLSPNPPKQEEVPAE